ncbi:MAG TPA: ATP-grasp domain-containing protein [Candidatus Limnocylindria bacterium]|nr:ATP-grasp domain-containing protein [Candidatus Limnocylindria bacterium]
MNVLVLSPGYPSEMPQFTRGLKDVGARAVGLGDQHESALPPATRQALSAYFRVSGFADEDAVIAEARRIASQIRIERVACLWEPLMVLAARIRETLGLPGMTVAETIPFRDKETMKQVLDAAGIRTPWHKRAHSVAQVLEAAEQIGFPLIVKPIAGAGSKDTHRINNRAELDAVLPHLRHVQEVSVEEFVDGDEFTFDTVCVNGEIAFYNICAYRPRPLIARQLEWVSPQTVALRRPDVPELEAGRRMGAAVLAAMHFQTGFTHMEWYRKADGEAVFGEIAARPPGAFTVDIMNYASDIDLFRGWAEAEVHGRFTQTVERRYNCASIFKRAQGQGRIQRIEGLGPLLTEFGPHMVVVDLLPPGSPRRDWLQTLISDGMVIVRHPDFQTTIDIADRVGSDLQMVAG